MHPFLQEEKEKFLKIHYEPEHEHGQTCWCAPTTLVKEGVAHIEHNEQRVLLSEWLKDHDTRLLTKVREFIGKEFEDFDPEDEAVYEFSKRLLLSLQDSPSTE